MAAQYSCHKISPGTVTGEALISSEPILFYQTDPKTGIVTEPGHCLNGKCVKDKIVIFPGGKGSSVVQADGMYKLDRSQTAPRGLIVQKLDTVLVSTAIIMEIPMVDRVDQKFYGQVKDGDLIQIDTERQVVEIL